MTPLVALRGLCKSFGALVVTDRVDLTLSAGDRHALIGPNGAGKTTLVNLLTGELTPSAGAITLLGRDVTNLSVARRARRGLVRTFQLNQLLVGLSLLENVQLAVLEREGVGGSMRPARGAQRRAAEEAYDLLATFGLAAAALEPVAQLPYGRQRLLEVVIAMALQPKVLLLDEPAAGVPPADSERMMEVIAGLPDSIAILVIEHDMDLVFRFATRISVLVSGAILCEGTPADVASHARVREVYLGNADG